MIQKLGKVTVALLIANLALWVYFWAAFALASEPYDPRPWGHFPIDPYSVWGYAIGLKKSAFMYPFMKVIFWAEFPSVLLVTLIQRVLFSKVSADAFFLGISAGGYKLLAIMFLSFGQWYAIGKLIQRLTRRGGAGAETPMSIPVVQPRH
jgi:hypothetical protein